jgi:hypothetical protein
VIINSHIKAYTSKEITLTTADFILFGVLVLTIGSLNQSDLLILFFSSDRSTHQDT